MIPFRLSYDSLRLLVNTKWGQRRGRPGQQLGAHGKCSQSSFHPPFQPLAPSEPPALHRFYPGAQPGAEKPQTSSYPLSGKFFLFYRPFFSQSSPFCWDVFPLLLACQRARPALWAQQRRGSPTAGKAAPRQGGDESF